MGSHATVTHLNPGTFQLKPTCRKRCLKCRIEFDSFGPGNRICPRCAGINRDALRIHGRMAFDDVSVPGRQ